MSRGHVRFICSTLELLISLVIWKIWQICQLKKFYFDNFSFVSEARNEQATIVRKPENN